MKKNIYLLLFAVIAFSGRSIGQTSVPCRTSEVREKYLQTNPEIIAAEKQLDKVRTDK